MQERPRRGAVHFEHYGCSVLSNNRTDKHSAAELDDRLVSDSASSTSGHERPQPLQSSPLPERAKWLQRATTNPKQIDAPT